MKITVTADDISNGEPEHPQMCPIGLAMRREGLRGIQVEQYEIHAGDFVMETPVKCQNFIERFDEGKPVKPFSFEFKGKGK